MKRSPALVTYGPNQKMWFVRRFDTIGVVKREGIRFRPARLGFHGPLCRNLKAAVAWIVRRENKRGIDRP